MCNRNVIEDDVERLGTGHETVADLAGNLVTKCQELIGTVLGLWRREGIRVKRRNSILEMKHTWTREGKWWREPRTRPPRHKDPKDTYHNRFEDFVSERRQKCGFVVDTNGLVHLLDLLRVRTGEDTELQVHLLEICDEKRAGAGNGSESISQETE